MRNTLPRISRVASLSFLLIFAGYPLAHQLTRRADAAVQKRRQHRTPTPTPTDTTQIDATPTPTPQPRRGQRTGTTDATTSTPTPTPTPGGMSTGEKVAIAGGIGAIIAVAIAAHGHGNINSHKLSHDGPQFPDSFSFSRFAVKGFVRGNWPVFVEYELEEPGHVVFSIKADGVDDFSQELDGTPGRHETLLKLPAEFGDAPQVGTYTIVAIADDPSAVAASRRRPRPISLKIYTLGVGDKAVGSPGIDQISFGPSSVKQNESASYRFHSLFEFNRATVDFMRIERARGGEINAKRIGRKDLERGIQQDAWIENSWDCKEGRKPSLGVHQLHVRAWRGVDSGGDWVAAMSKEFVRVEQ